MLKSRIANPICALVQRRTLAGLPERFLPMKPLHPIQVHPFQDSYKMVPMTFKYRDPNVIDERHWFAQFLGGFMWWWVLWNTWCEPKAWTGHYDYFDARLLSDEELGIPPDDME